MYHSELATAAIRHGRGECLLDECDMQAGMTPTDTEQEGALSRSIVYQVFSCGLSFSAR